MDNLKVEQDNAEIRASMTTISDAESVFSKTKKVEHVFLLTAAWRMFADFTKNSTVHGVKYLGERKRHWSERIFWVIVFFVSITGCSFLIMKMYDKWQKSPVISSFAEKSTPVWKIPFPAVTICPEIKAKFNVIKIKDSLNALIDGKPLTDDDLIKMDALTQLCSFSFNQSSKIELNDIPKILKKISPTLKETIGLCKWNKNSFKCYNHMKTIMTEEGSCFTFNMLSTSEIFKDNVFTKNFVKTAHNRESFNWSIETGYTSNDEDTFPRRVVSLDEDSGLRITLYNEDIDIDRTCNGYVKGFKVTLHSPWEVPQFTKHFFHVPLKNIAKVIVRPNMIKTSEGLKSYSPERRQCLFNNEKYLKFFKIYTQNNCELECLTDFTLKVCECVKFSMPREEGTLKCTSDDKKCYMKAKNQFIKKEYFQSFKSVINETLIHKCNCLPSCTSINYDYSISQQVSRPILSISFDDPKVTTTERSELYGVSDFMANCGGVLGLFMGVSLLSIIELIYYFTLRLACNLGCRRKHPEIIATTAAVDFNQTDSLENGQFMNQ